VPRGTSEGKVSDRSSNERKFGSWLTSSSGGRVYRRIVAGRSGWSAAYCKEVDADENTVRFWQEIFDESGRLREVHEKFPVDRGHRQV
jgi:hypothetical protein